MAKAYEGDYQFGEAGQFDKRFRGLRDRLKSDRLKPIAVAFQLNVERVVSMNCLPIELIHWSAFTARGYCVARVDLGLRPTDESRDQWPEMQSVLKIAIAAMMEGRHAVSNEDAANRAWADGTRFLKAFLHPLIENTRPDLETREYLIGGVEAILAAMVTSGYAAFETLATDLWIEAVNSSTLLAASWVKKNPKKELKLEDIAGHDFNLAGSMGTALYQTGKASFLSLNDLTDCFKSAFDSKVDACFEPRIELYEAEKIRHLLAHRGGVIDAKFKREMQDFPAYEAQAEGDRVKLTGPVVCRHVGACVGSAVRLIEAVDSWLVEHAPKT